MTNKYNFLTAEENEVYINLLKGKFIGAHINLIKSLSMKLRIFDYEATIEDCKAQQRIENYLYFADKAA